MAPIRKGDGTPLEIPGVQEVRAGDGRVFFDDAIPDSVVTRPDDDRTAGSDGLGVEFESTEEWPEIGFRLSQNVEDPVEASLFDADHTLLQSKNISGLEALDTFTIDQQIEANQTYYIELTDVGTAGGLDSHDAPYESDDGVLTITDASQDGASIGDMYNILEIGNVGFD